LKHNSGDTGTGTCFSSASTVQVLSKTTGLAETRQLSEVEVHDELLAVDRTHKGGGGGRSVWAAVKSLPHSKSAATDRFIEIEMKGQETTSSSSLSLPSSLPLAATHHHLSVTEHHTFPSCHGGGGATVEAGSLKAGDCLLLQGGSRAAIASATRRLAGASEATYTVELEGQADLLVVGGVVTHARSAARASQKSAEAKLRSNYHSSTKKIQGQLRAGY
jgi:hypothetical protein